MTIVIEFLIEMSWEEASLYLTIVPMKWIIAIPI